MAQYTITLNAAEDAALAYASVSQQDWIENSAKHRASIAVEEIVALTVQKCLETTTPIPGSKEAMVTLAFEQGWIKTAEQRKAEAEAARLAEQEQSAE
jgi:hypothetical protein